MTPFDLNIRHLRIFREVARRKSVSIAAEKEHLSQSAVTQAVAKLNRQLGTKLLERRSDGMSVTDVGQAFLPRVDRALLQLQTGAQEAVRLGHRRGNCGFPQFDRLLTTAQLRALTATADARNFSMAAREIGVSQPSLYRAARATEQLSGLTLFRTTPEGVALTPAGLELARRGKLAISELKQGLDQVAIHLDRETSLIVVGSLPLVRTAILPDATADLIAERDGVEVQVIDGPYEQLLAKLREGSIDFLIGALRLPPPTTDIKQEPLFDDPLALVVGAAHPLLRKERPVLADTFGYPWVAPPRTTPAGRYLFEKLKAAAHGRLAVRVLSSSLAFIRGMLASGPFISIISVQQARYEIDSGLVVPLPISLPDSARFIGLTFRADWRPTPTQQRFLELIRQAAAREHRTPPAPFPPGSAYNLLRDQSQES